MKYPFVLFFIIAVFCSPSTLLAQERERTMDAMGSNLWLGSYNSFRLSERLFWRAEMHYRRGGHDGTPFVGRMSQIYNRHAFDYLVTKNFTVSYGGVLRLDFTPDPGNPEFNQVVPEPRFWHEYLFMMPFSRFQIYHRVRLEHRWSKSNRLNDDWIFRNRWRYKFFMKIPLNNTRLVPGTIYFNPDVEIILQTGKRVVASHIEDLRIYPSIAYISSPRVTYTAGMMYTTGQRLNNPTLYRQRWVMRINAYVNLDFRKVEKKIPAVRLLD
ncbi:MAG: DUF2490 domain-containing protein [Cytophagaceae bacterium]